ncbi:MAG: hypothetical protein AAFW46_17490 [Pseudomonadota bacterium]
MTGRASTPGTAGAGTSRAPLAIVLGGVVLAALLAAWLGWSSGVRLDRSAAGFEGLVQWLRANETEARMFRGGAALTREQVGLRVLPLHDVDLMRDAATPETKRDALLAETERDVDAFTVELKTALLPTLVVLPKWRAGIRSLAVAHPDLLASEDAVARVAGQLLGEARPALVRRAGWSEIAWSAARRPAAPDLRGDLRAYHLQTLRGSGCAPLLEVDDALLLGRCGEGDRAFWLLTDPDLLNNHGLSNGENARLALEALETLAEDGPILVDATDRVWASRGRSAPPRERTWADLARFLEPPFTILLTAFGLLSALAVWRAWVRDRAPIPPEADGVAGARRAAIDAKARLLRLSGHDAELTRAYVADRLQALAAEALGPHRAHGAAGVAQLRRALGRRSSALALELDEFARPDLPARDAPPSQLLAHLDRFDRFAERVRDALALSLSPTPSQDPDR